MECDVKLAWAAGFYEGEGSCGVWGKRRWNVKQGRWYNPQLRVDVVQKRREPLDELKLIFGFGSVLYDKYNQAFHYRISSKMAKNFLEKVLPFIINPQKREQAQMALNKYQDITGHGGSCGV